MNAAASSDDALFSIKRSALVDNRGVSYTAKRRTLTPRWGVVWRDLALGWLTVIGIMIPVIQVSHVSVTFAVLSAVAGAVLVGFFIAFVMLFIHEAAHRNIHPDPRWNDILNNLFISGILGADVETYRRVHWEHHRNFGNAMDTEISYRDPLNLRFVVEALFGIRLARSILLRRSQVRSLDAQKAVEGGSGTRVYVLLGGLLFNAALVSGLAYGREWAAIFAWVCGIFVVFPFLGALRQILEHRGELPPSAHATADTICFATNRLFGDGPLAGTLGAAGFNRHLLHHWDPQVSYTRLRELEEYLLDTEAGGYLRQHQTTYFDTFFQLFTISARGRS